jgi:hypothetical protein
MSFPQDSTMKIVMNREMSRLLERMKIRASELDQLRTLESMPTINASGCTFFREEYERNSHVRLEDFQDKTGYECFINHLHRPYSSDRSSLDAILAFVVGLSKALASTDGLKRFLTILSIGEGEEDCTVRFHECRPGESWISGDLESYTEEAILLVST